MWQQSKCFQIFFSLAVQITAEIVAATQKVGRKCCGGGVIWGTGWSLSLRSPLIPPQLFLNRGQMWCRLPSSCLLKTTDWVIALPFRDRGTKRKIYPKTWRRKSVMASLRTKREENHLEKVGFSDFIRLLSNTVCCHEGFVELELQWNADQNTDTHINPITHFHFKVHFSVLYSCFDFQVKTTVAEYWPLGANTYIWLLIFPRLYRKLVD